MSIFSNVFVRKPKSSAFNLSHERKLSANMGDLVPVLVQEVLPSDKFKLRMENLVRFQALKSPMMHRVDVSTFFFFVPYRLLWNEWEDFITGGEDGTSNPVFPQIHIEDDELDKAPVGGILDHLGLPVQQFSGGTNLKINALPLRAYYLIWNEYFRDQNISNPIPIDKGSGIKNLSQVIVQDGKCLRRAWQKDYFTSALPWAQRGPNVTLNTFADNPRVARKLPGGQIQPLYVERMSQQDNYKGVLIDGTQDNFEAQADPIIVDSEANVTSINELRRAYRLQEWLEKNARGGGRYIEQILSHFGVKSSDARLQRPELLTAGKSPVMISEVLQQSQTTETSPQGNMAGHGVGASSTPYFNRKFEEHGLIIGLMAVTPQPAYMQGIPKLYSKFDKFDYYFPEFDSLGEQPILNQELYYDGYIQDGPNEETFGYTPRYAEYRYIPNTVHGDMRTNLKFWHMANDYSETPNLNEKFIECDPTHRVFAVEDKNYQKLIIQTYCDFKAIRPMSKYAIPKL